MKTILLYAWGVFLAALTGVAVFDGAMMLLNYVDTRIADVMNLFGPSPLTLRYST